MDQNGFVGFQNQERKVEAVLREFINGSDINKY